MDQGRGNVIRFPAWRREADGAPGVPAVPEMRPSQKGRSAASAEAVDVAGDNSPVWHEGASVTDEVIVRLRIDILGIKPPIWRRLECLGSLTLDQVHPILAAAFDLDPQAEYRFRDVTRWEGSTHIGPTFCNQWTRRTADHAPEEWTVPLAGVLGAPRERLRYDYGRFAHKFGFPFTIVAEDVIPLPPAAAGPVPTARCLGGRRSMPPPDFPSIGIYDLILGGSVAPGSPLAELIGLELPEGWEPEAFDRQVADARVRAAALTVEDDD